MHVLVAEVHGHRLVPLLDTSAFLGLGRAVDERGELGAGLRVELATTLADYVRRARDVGAAAIAIVGTDPLRRATDAAEALARIQAATDVPVAVLDHEGEALLTLLGVTAGRPVMREIVVVDIGGGSSEVLHVDPSTDPRAVGLPLGSARLSNEIIEHDPPTAAELDAMLAAARAALATAPDATATSVIAVGGTASNLLKIVRPSRDHTINRKRLAEALLLLLSEPAAVVSEQFSVRPERARVLAAGAAIVGALFERYGVERIRVSDAGIREGAVLASVHAGPSWQAHLPWLAHGWSRGLAPPTPVAG